MSMHSRLWLQLIERLETKLGKHTAALWVRPCRLLRYEGGTMEIVVPGSLAMERWRSGLAEAASAACESLTGSRPAVRLHEVVPLGHQDRSLDSFRVVEGNHMAFRAVLALARRPSEPPFHPLTLFGEAGCGKTHLARGLSAYWSRKFPKEEGAFLTGRAFAYRVTRAIRTRRMGALRDRLMGSSYLLLDGLEQLSRKRACQQELRGVMDCLKDRGRPLVMTSRFAPEHLDCFSDGVMSRLKGGMVVRIAPLAHEEFKDRRIPPPRATLEAVEEEVGRYFGVPAGRLAGRLRRRSLSKPRSLAIYLSRRLTSSSDVEIASFFGGRSTDAIRRTERSVGRAMGSDVELRGTAETLELRVAERGAGARDAVRTGNSDGLLCRAHA
jgi:chromosomal replication initiation ATPase DnaA